MASTFRRNTKGKTKTTTSTQQQQGKHSLFLLSSLVGTKPATGGVTLTSFGLRDADQILGGGQPLGTCVLLEQDRWTKSLATTLMKYWCAQVSEYCSVRTVGIAVVRRRRRGDDSYYIQIIVLLTTAVPVFMFFCRLFPMDKNLSFQSRRKITSEKTQQMINFAIGKGRNVAPPKDSIAGPTSKGD